MIYGGLAGLRAFSLPVDSGQSRPPPYNMENEIKINQDKWPDAIKLDSKHHRLYVPASIHNLANFRQRQMYRMPDEQQREHRQRAMRAAYIRNHPQTTNGSQI